MQPPRRRNNFTKDDDLILLRTISVPGTKINGNTIYQQIEAQNPSHSWHGWRSRWVDHYGKRSPADPAYWYKKLTGEHCDTPGKAQQQRMGRTSITASSAPVDFSAEDDNILKRYRFAVEESEDKLEAWENLHDRYLHHSASAWRRRYNELFGTGLSFAFSGFWTWSIPLTDRPPI